MAAVSIERHGNVSSVTATAEYADRVSELVTTKLRYFLKIRNDWQMAKQMGKKYRSELRCLYQKMPMETGCKFLFNSGLLSKLGGLLNDAKIAWTMADARPIKLPPPQMQLMELDKMKDRPDQLDILARMFSHDNGVIDAPTGAGKTHLICQFIRAYPKTNIIVCTYRREVAAMIHSRLREHVRASELGMISGTKKQKKCRVTVCTIGSLEHADVERCGIFIYDEVHEAASEGRAEKLGRITNAKMFGFSASPVGRSDGSDLLTEAIFGPIIYRQTYQEAEGADRVATISVEWLTVHGTPTPYDDEVQQFRWGIWRNGARNRLIADAATRHVTNGRQTLIIVDKIEHALALKSAYLPDWPLVHGVVSEDQIKDFQRAGLLKSRNWLCTEEQRELLRKQFERGHLRAAIATGVWGVGVDFKHLTALIRADGRSAAIPSTQVPGRLSRGEYGILVDFDDLFDERFKRRSDTRLRLYRSKGWTIESQK